MTWFRVDDRLPDHRKARKAGTSAMGLWVLAGAWSAGHLTDGWVPREVALRYGTERQAERLEAAGLWVADDLDGEIGWFFHQWTDHQPTREQVHLRRKKAADRQAEWRSKRGSGAGQKGMSRGDTSVSNGDSNAAPDPTRPDPTIKKKNTPPTAASLRSEFEQFWSAYPRKVGKKDAERKFAKAIQGGVTPAEVIAAARAYAAQPQDPRYIAHPATWLHQGRWEDEPTPHLRAVGEYRSYRNPADQSVYDDTLL